MILPIVNSDNGYVAGYVFLPLFILICLSSVLLFLTGIGFIITSKKLLGFIY